jgi:hypothetical protein
MFLVKIATFFVMKDDAEGKLNSFQELQIKYMKKSDSQKSRLRKKVMKEIFPTVWSLRNSRRKVRNLFINSFNPCLDIRLSRKLDQGGCTFGC